MKKNYPALILFLFLGSYSFSQTKATPTTTAVKTETKPVSVPAEASVPEASPAQVLEKNPLPVIQKGAPAIFYIENDQPIDRQTYLLHSKQALPKK